MPKGIPKNGINKGWFKKGDKPKTTGQRQYTKCLWCRENIRTFKSRPRRFCGHSCATRHRWKVGELQQRKKVEPWNKGLKGIHLSPDTEFKYQGKGKQFKGKSDYWWRQKAREVMQMKDNDSRHVHHIDGDITNNNKDNLVVLTSSEHTKLHHKQGDIKTTRPKGRWSEFPTGA